MLTSQQATLPLPQSTVKCPSAYFKGTRHLDIEEKQQQKKEFFHILISRKEVSMYETKNKNRCA